MARHIQRNQRKPGNLDEFLFSCLERETFLTFRQIHLQIDAICQEKGAELWAENTIRNHLERLIALGKIKHQEAGYLIDRGWKQGQPKAFILVELAVPKKRGENHQTKLVAEIRDSFRLGEHGGLNLIGVDVTMGAEFSLIIQVYADSLHYIGRFVKEYLLTNEQVTKTRTVMVWPMEPGESASSP